MTATCSTGKSVLGGGGLATNTNFVMVASNFGTDSTWVATFQNTATKAQTGTATAICAFVQ